MNMKSALLPLLVLTLSLHGFAPNARAQVAGAPALIDYQGTVFDGTTGYPLGSTGTSAPFTAAPKNYTMNFKIYGSPTGADLIWAETQTVTVSVGQFSVRLGSGAQITSPSTLPHDSLTLAFNTKERYLEVTVLDNGSGTPILPRLAFQSTPFSFVAQRAAVADSVSGVISTGSSFSGTVAAAGSTFTGGTFGTVGAQATFIGSGSFGSVGTPATFTGNGAGVTNLNGANLNTGSVDLAKLTAAVQEALCPPGTIVAYGGDNAPAGWLVCAGGSYPRTGTYAALYAAIGTRFGTANGSSFNVPDFRGLFLRGRDGSVGRDPDRNSRTAMNFGGSTGDSVGSVQGHALQSHTHTYTKVLGTVQADDSGSSYNEITGLGNAQTVGQTGSASTETRPINAYVTYIIKY